MNTVESHPNQDNETLLNDVLQDIMNQNQKEKQLFQKTLEKDNDSNSLPPNSQTNHSKNQEHNYEPQNTDEYYTNPQNIYSGSVNQNVYTPSPMDLLKESLKWSLIVAGILFLFQRTAVINNLISYMPSKFITDGSLNTFGSLLVSFIGGIIFFILFHWIL